MKRGELRRAEDVPDAALSVPNKALKRTTV